MNIKKIAAAVIILCLLAGFSAGCGREKKEAVQVMTDYLNNIIQGEYSEAYSLLSDFDKGNISEETFISWRKLAARLVSVKSFNISSTVDTFKNYKYSGTEFGNVYGLKVDSRQEMLVPNVDLMGYDKNAYRIMVQKQGKEYRVLLLLSDIEDTVARYNSYVGKLG